MPKYTLEKKSDAFLTLEINGKDYKIPLMTRLKIKELRKLKKLMTIGDLDKADQFEVMEIMAEFLAEYLGNEIVEDMTIEDFNQVFTLWQEANTSAGDLKLGES